jgi:hypothetical protein
MLRAQRKSRTSNSAPVPMVCEVCRSQPVEAVVVEFNPEQDPHLYGPACQSNPRSQCDDRYRTLELSINVSLIATFQIAKGDI